MNNQNEALLSAVSRSQGTHGELVLKERPILFSSEMVRAILEGRKTQTRRVVKLKEFQPCTFPEGSEWIFRDKRDCWNDVSTKLLIDNYCPYGKPGDKLWVRETWAHDDMDCKDAHCGNSDHIWYRASEEPIVADSFAGSAAWKPSIFMPRWASRITLEIVNIRVERLHQIDKAGATAEGITADFYNRTALSWWYEFFSEYWDSLNAKRGYSWESNPWVWVIEFKRLEG